MPADAPNQPLVAAATPRPQLSLLDSTSIIVGIIIGSAIYEISPTVAAAAIGWTARWVSPAWQSSAELGVVLAIWLVGGLIGLLGALCYAELTTAYPHAGGSYVFLTRAFGKGVGLAFAWSEFWIVRPGNVGAVAFVLARYAAQLFPATYRDNASFSLILAAGAIVALSAVNAIGLRAGKWTQNLLTAAKVLGLLAIVIAALTLSPGSQPARPMAASEPPSVVLALILVMFAYGGWSDMSFVAAEVRDPRRNLFRALVLGTGAVTVIYLMVNLAFIAALGIPRLAQTDAVAAKVLSLRFDEMGSAAISVLVVVSCLGAINGMIFTGARVFYALGTEHAAFSWLGQWNESAGAPLRALAVQTIVTLGLVVVFGRSPEAFNGLVIFTGPFYWGFFTLVGVGLFLLRLRGATGQGTYRVPAFPLTPLVFCLSSGAMTLAGLNYLYVKRFWESPWQTGWAVGVVVSGLVVCALDWYFTRQRATSQVS
jgi:amino acid transporter